MVFKRQRTVIKILRDVKICLPKRPDVIIRWLWYLNGSVAILAGLVLIIGFLSLFFSGPSLSGAPLRERAARTDDSDEPTREEGESSDSLLVQLAREYSNHINPKQEKKPVDPQSNGENAPDETIATEDIKPAPPPPPPPPPPPTVPKPSFSLISTIVIGQDAGIAWILIPGEKDPKAFVLGDEIEKYKLKKVQNGRVQVEREGKDFTLDVPQPQPSEMLTAPEISSPHPAPPSEPRQIPRRPMRPGRRK